MTVRGVVFDWGGTLTPFHDFDLADLWAVAARILAPERQVELTGALVAVEGEFWQRVRSDGGLASTTLDDVVAMAAERTGVHVEAVLRAHAASFLDLEASAALLARWRATGQGRLPAALDGRDGELLLFEVLRRLLEESVPVADVDTIVAGFRNVEPRPADVQHVVERIRLSLAGRLPGAGGSREVVDLPRAVETAIGQQVRTSGGRTFLAMPPAQERTLRDAVLRVLGDRDPASTALRVRGRALRPFVRRFTERFLPGLAVVSGAELARARAAGGDAAWS